MRGDKKLTSNSGSRRTDNKTWNHIQDNNNTKTLIFGFFPILPSTEPSPAAAAEEDVADLFKLSAIQPSKYVTNCW